MIPHPENIKGHTLLMLPVPGTAPGQPFMMGRPDDDPIEEDWENNQKPAHPVQLGDFHIGQYPVTQALWRAVVEADCPAFEKLKLETLNPSPSDFQGELRPVEQVSWLDAQVFIQKLNLLTAESRPEGAVYRLPTEAEWEYAARGGPYSEGYRYAGSDKLSEVGWFEDNSESETHEVGLLMANELGLYDMSGNVWEWCADWYDSRYYEECLKKGAQLSPAGPDTGSNRVMRGGSWSYAALHCRVAFRDGSAPGYRWHDGGFRLVLAPQ